MLLGYARHEEMGILFIDPQGQFSAGKDLPFDLHERLSKIGREVQIYHLSTKVRLPSNVPLLGKLLYRTGFYRKIAVRARENQGYAEEEIVKAMKAELESQGQNWRTPEIIS